MQSSRELPFSGTLLARDRLSPNEGSKSDPAHPAIYPTGVSGITVIQPQQQQQSIVPHNNEISPHSQQQSPIIRIPNQPTMR